MLFPEKLICILGRVNTLKIAVLMSSYNGEAYIRQQIDSVLAQQCDGQPELWVRDDGSSDSTRDILQQYADAGLLQWYTGENLKPAHSFMDLILHCPGYDYYAFADQDDFWMPDKLARGITQLEGVEGPGLFFANAQLVDQDLNYLGRDVYRVPPPTDFHTLACAGGILGCTCVFNRALAELLQSRPMPGAIVMHDFYAALVCVLAGGAIRYDAEPKMQYRQHGSNVVGVSRGKLHALRDRLRIITHRPGVTVGQQADTLLAQYPDLGSEESRRWLRLLSDSRLSSRLTVALSTKTRYATKNQGITLRLSHLMGNH